MHSKGQIHGQGHEVSHAPSLYSREEGKKDIDSVGIASVLLCGREVGSHRICSFLSPTEIAQVSHKHYFSLEGFFGP